MENTKLAGLPKEHSMAKVSSDYAQALVELDYYKILVESIEDYAIFLIDPKGYILTWNKGAEKNKGYKSDEIIGKHFSIFYQQKDKDAEKPKRELALAMQMGRVEDEDWRVRKDGTKFWANVVITTLYNAKNEHIGFAKVTRDLTERKHQEDNVLKSNVRLKHQQQELERLNQSKDEFISLASHQLRTPATAVKQLLGILYEGFYGEVPAHMLPIIAKAYESNERQLNIVNSLLKVAQIDAGKVVLHKVDTNINSLLTNLIDEFKDVFSSRKQIVTVHLPHDEPVFTYVDPDYIRMAISNIVDNASKYTPPGGKLEFDLQQNEGVVTISISDSGVGISDQDINKLFSKFVRIPNSLSQKVGGSGLGLYWLQKVVELHGGKIHVKSKLDLGTTFILELPKLTAE